MKKEMLSIAIPTYNEEKDIGNCLKAISSQNYPKDLIEVIIIDNYSTDETLKIVKSFSKKLSIKVLMNQIKDAEVSKKIGFDNSNGEFFMYLDADMKFHNGAFIRKMLFPFKDNEKIAGNFVNFVVNKSHPPLTRTLSYDEFQRDPIFKFFTIGIKDVMKENRKNYWLCECTPKKIPPQGLMIYKKRLIEEYVKDKKQLVDNEIPAVLVEQGNNYFAYVPDTGVEHMLLRSLKELGHKRIRNLNRTYFPNESTRKYKWINWKKDFTKMCLWMIYTNSFVLPIVNSIVKTIKYRDICFLAEPALNLVSTYSIIYGVLKNKL